MYRDGRVRGGVDMNQAVVWFDEGLSRGHARSGYNAALHILEDRPSDYAPFDAAAFAAKSSALSGRYASKSADILNDLPRKLIDGGAQRLMVDLGADLAVDGAFGPASQAELQKLLDRHNAGTAETDPMARILQLAALTWRTNPFRIDLY